MSNKLDPKRSNMTMIRAARRIHQKDGQIEVDYPSKSTRGCVSRGEDPGAYVKAWVWVYFGDVTDEDRKD